MLRRDRWQNMESGRCWTAFGCFGKLTGMGGQAARNGFRAVSLACASLALALMTFVGWISELPLLASVRAKYIPMAPSSALCFSLIDIGIIMQIVRPALRWFTRVLTVLVLAIACVKLVESIRSMAKGDLIMLFTNGLFEVEDQCGNVFSQEQLHTTVNRHAALTPEEFFARVLNDIRHFSNQDAFNDDVCVVGVQVRHTG
jgi:Stage II sporulation protein E (SpoIIE)